MTDKNPDILEQNKRINELSRRVGLNFDDQILETMIFGEPNDRDAN